MSSIQQTCGTDSVHTNPSIRVDKLRTGVSRQHVDDDHLTPLLNVHQQVTQLAVILVNEVNPFWTHLHTKSTLIRHAKLTWTDFTLKFSRKDDTVIIFGVMEIIKSLPRNKSTYAYRILTSSNAITAEPTTSVVLSERSFSITCISSSFCSGSRLKERKKTWCFNTRTIHPFTLRYNTNAIMVYSEHLLIEFGYGVGGSLAHVRWHVRYCVLDGQHHDGHNDGHTNAGQHTQGTRSD